MGLDDPNKKMSKTASSPNNYVALLDSPEIARKKIMKAITDSGSDIKSGADKPALTNLLTIYSLLSEVSVKEIEEQYKGKGYADFKNGLAEEVVKFLKNFQEKFEKIKDEKILDILASGAKKASEIAGKKMIEVKKKIGLLPLFNR